MASQGEVGTSSSQPSARMPKITSTIACARSCRRSCRPGPIIQSGIFRGSQSGFSCVRLPAKSSTANPIVVQAKTIRALFGYWSIASTKCGTDPPRKAAPITATTIVTSSAAPSPSFNAMT